MHFNGKHGGLKKKTFCFFKDKSLGFQENATICAMFKKSILWVLKFGNPT
jgi:hypothetical protein